MKRIEVVAAIIHDAEGRIFATQRGYGEFKDGWEFPGGKMEAGETPEEALRREIWEELETRIEVERLVETVEYDYPQFHLTMHCFLCRVVSGRLELKEHEADGVEPQKPYSGKLNLRMPSELHSRVAAFVAASGTTINDFINCAIRNELNKVAAI